MKMATGTPVQIQVNPSAPSEFGANHRDANGGFHVDNTKIASAFKQMTGHDAERFVVTVRNFHDLVLACASHSSSYS